MQWTTWFEMSEFFLKRTNGQKWEAKLMRKQNTFDLIRTHASFQRQMNKFRTEVFVPFCIMMIIHINSINLALCYFNPNIFSESEISFRHPWIYIKAAYLAITFSLGLTSSQYALRDLFVSCSQFSFAPVADISESQKCKCCDLRSDYFNKLLHDSKLN